MVTTTGATRRAPVLFHRKRIRSYNNFEGFAKIPAAGLTITMSMLFLKAPPAALMSRAMRTTRFGLMELTGVID
jgi:hypothetical protein